ncbi:MAG: hypothetical protein H6984_11020 [Pseudomonadales bacterium]|nr:hypothetical protein [Halioglobus sp.]MCP5122989.1 hypothetical protein [Pseudomonadales bacterium]
MEKLLFELKQRWAAMFAALAAGDDVPPAQRLRAEGMMEAALLTRAADVEALDCAMADRYQQAVGRTIEEDFGADWRAFYPFPQIPAMGRRAPVYPSTRD